jgi:ankyrin repeat protein
MTVRDKTDKNKLLIEILKKDPSAFLIQNYDNNTALHQAAYSSSRKMCKILMSFATDEIWKKWEPRGFKQKTRNILSWCEFLALLMLLRKHREYPINDSTVEIIKILLEKVPNIANIQDFKGRTIFYFLSKKDRHCAAHLFELLLQHGMDLSLTDEDGNNALHYLAKILYKFRLELPLPLLRPDPKLLNQQNKYGDTPVMVAVGTRYFEWISIVVCSNLLQM